MNAPSPSYRFDRFEVRPTERQLLRDGVPVRLGARAVDLLATLIAHRERVLSRHELMALAWPRLQPQERHLLAGLTVLRRHIGAETIATIPGRGYRFTAQLREEADAFELAIRPQRRNGAVAAAGSTLVARPLDQLDLLGALKEQRVTALVGEPGCGKSRLAWQVMQELQSRYRHGVVWVDLSAVPSTADVVDAVAAAMSINVGGRGERGGALAAALAPYHLLLALDRAEHLIDTLPALLAALLAGAPELQLLVISRLPMAMPGLRTLTLAGLACPLEAEPTPAVELMLVRARTRDPRYAPRREDMPALATLARRVGGNPLALELLAAQLPLQGAGVLCAQMTTLLRPGTGGGDAGGTAVVPLEDVMRWSWTGLSPTERHTLRWLSVFRGSPQLALARRVAAQEHDDDRFADTLAALVDEGWISVAPGEPPRYALAPALRGFALRELRAAGEEDRARQRHALALRQPLEGLAEAWMAGLEPLATRGGAPASPQHSSKLEDGRKALAWALQHDAATAVALAPGLALLMAPSYRPRHQMWKATAPLLQADMPALLRARWYCGSAVFWAWHKPDLARSHARAAVALLRATGDRRGLYRALAALASARSPQALDEVRAALEEMQQLEDPAWPPALRRAGFIALANVRTAQADWAGAIDAHQRSMALAHSLRQEGLVTQQITLMHLELAAQRWDAAVARAQAARERILGARARVPVVGIDMVLVLARLWQGRLGEARSLAQACWPQTATFDLQGPMACSLALLAALEGRTAVSARLAGYAAEAFRRAEMTPTVSARRALAQAGRQARQALGEEEAARLHAEGTLLADADVPALAFGDADATGAGPDQAAGSMSR